jgi:hypothetical protein
MILFCEVGDEHLFFEKVWRLLSDDIQYQIRDTVGERSYQMSDEDLRDCLLDELSTIFSKSGHNIRDYNLPRIVGLPCRPATNRLIEEELAHWCPQYNEQNNLADSLNYGQLQAFNAIVTTVTDNRPGFFFVSGYGGKGKTYLWKCSVISEIATKDSSHCCVFRRCLTSPTRWPHGSLAF